MQSRAAELSEHTHSHIYQEVTSSHPSLVEQLETAGPWHQAKPKESKGAFLTAAKQVVPMQQGSIEGGKGPRGGTLC